MVETNSKTSEPLTPADVERWERLATMARGRFNITSYDANGEAWEFWAEVVVELPRLCADWRRLAKELDEAQQEHQRFVEFHESFSDECEKKIEAAERERDALRAELEAARPVIQNACLLLHDIRLAPDAHGLWTYIVRGGDAIRSLHDDLQALAAFRAQEGK